MTLLRAVWADVVGVPAQGWHCLQVGGPSPNLLLNVFKVLISFLSIDMLAGALSQILIPLQQCQQPNIGGGLD